MRKHRDIKLVSTEPRRSYLVSEPIYHKQFFFQENLLAIKIRKTQILMNKPVYLGLSILELSKIVLNKFWYGYLKPKYGQKTKLCYIDTDSFYTVHVKTDDIYEDIAKDVEKMFGTSNYKLDKPLPKGKK